MLGITGTERSAAPSVTSAMNRPHEYKPVPSSGAQYQSTSSQKPPENQTYSCGNPAAVTCGIQLDGQSSAHVAPPLFLRQHLLLVTLAEEYLLLAHKVKIDDPEAHGRLIALALGCLEAILKQMKLPPSDEAEIRLRYAVVLHEHTYNLMEAEETLGQGITLCERHKMFDVKYNMQYLLCQVLYQRNPRASFALLENSIRVVEAYQHVPWVYAFRFLRVYLSLQCKSPPEVRTAMNHLKRISETAQKHADKAIVTIASIMEALLCLQLRAADERKEQAQRALAVAKGHQLDPSIQAIPSLMALMHVVDLGCALQAVNVPLALQTLGSVQSVLQHQSENWRRDGYFNLPVNAPAMLNRGASNGPIRTHNDGTQTLVFRWLPKDLAYALGFHLTGISTAHANIEKKLGPEHCLVEGIQVLEKYRVPASIVGRSPSFVLEEQRWHRLSTCHMRINLLFLLCARTAWVDAQHHLVKLVHESKKFQSDESADINVLSIYLQGLLHQGTGSLDKAFECFRHQTLKVPAPNQSSQVSQFCLELSILAALNTILLIRFPDHPMHHLQSVLFESIEPYCSLTSNKSLFAAYSIAQATSPSAVRISDTKDFLKSALTAAKVSANNSLKCVALTVMNQRFYTGILGPQSILSARASQSLAIKSGDNLWTSVCAGFLANTYEVLGQTQEALVCKSEGLKIAEGMPRELQRIERQGSDIEVMI